MNTKLKTGISLVRSFSRFYIDILGLVNQHILKSEFFLSEVRVLHEIEKTGNCTSRMLSDTLYIDVSYLSRIIRKLEKRGFVREKQSVIDGRAHNSYITDTGRGRMIQLNNTPFSRIVHLLKPSSEIDCGFLAVHMTVTGTLLAKSRNVNPQDTTIRTKIRPGNIGYITYLHGYICQEKYGYSTVFEHYVADSFAQFISQYQPGNDRPWCVEHHGNVIGYISIADHNERV